MDWDIVKVRANAGLMKGFKDLSLRLSDLIQGKSNRRRGANSIGPRILPRPDDGRPAELHRIDERFPLRRAT